MKFIHWDSPVETSKEVEFMNVSYVEIQDIHKKRIDVKFVEHFKKSCFKIFTQVNSLPSFNFRNVMPDFKKMADAIERNRKSNQFYSFFHLPLNLKFKCEK